MTFNFAMQAIDQVNEFVIFITKCDIFTQLLNYFSFKDSVMIQQDLKPLFKNESNQFLIQCDLSYVSGASFL